MSPRQVLRRGLSEGPPQAAQEGLQATRFRNQGRAYVQSGTRENGGGLLSDLHPADTLPGWSEFSDEHVLHEKDLSWLCLSAQKRGLHDCAFCRTPCPDNDADKLAMLLVRAKKKDPAAINFLGEQYFFGEFGLQKDMRKAVELWAEAADLGSIEAIFSLGNAHHNGHGVEQDEAKSAEFFKKAAIQGHADSRHSLGNHEGKKGNHDRAVRHFLISATMGLKDSFESIKMLFTVGIATKEQYAQALKGYQDAVEATKSHDRDEAKRFEGWKVGK